MSSQTGIESLDVAINPTPSKTSHPSPPSLQASAPCATFRDDSRYALRAQVPAGLNRKEAEIYSRLDPERLPHHIAIIMDGNGRWAKRRHLPRIAGHRSGVASVRSTVETAARLDIPALTLYSFSAENWKRPKGEVEFLMNLLRRYLKMELPTLMENNIRLQYIGRQQELPQEVQERMSWAREMTERNTGMVLTLVPFCVWPDRWSMRSSMTWRMAFRNSTREFDRCWRTVGETPTNSRTVSISSRHRQRS